MVKPNTPSRPVSPPPATHPGMRPGLVALFAVACGISAANLYYAQPLLPQISRDLHVGSGTTRPGHHRRPGGLRHRAGPHRPARGHPGPPPAGSRHPVVAAAALFGASAAPDLPSSSPPWPWPACARWRPRSSSPSPPRWPRTRAGPGGGHGDERPAARHPAGPDLLRPHRPGGRLAHRLRGRRALVVAMAALLHLRLPTEQTASVHPLRRTAGLRRPAPANRARSSACAPPSAPWSSPPST